MLLLNISIHLQCYNHGHYFWCTGITAQMLDTNYNIWKAKCFSSIFIQTHIE